MSVKLFMDANGITQKELAEYLVVSASLVSGWLNEKTDPEVENIIDMGKYLAKKATAPQIVEIRNIWAVRCLLKANELNNWDTKTPASSKYHENVKAYYVFDGNSGVSIRLERTL